MQEMLLNTLGIGGRGFVIDCGRRFEKPCAILGGTHIDFSPEAPISLNPFSEISEAAEDFESRNDVLAGIASVLATMAAPNHGVSDLQNALLQKALRDVWDELGSKAEITDVAAKLEKSDSKEGRDLSTMLFPFTRGGVFGGFFSGPAQLSLTGRIVVIETDNLRNVPALLAVVVRMVIVHINRVMMRSDRKKPFMTFIDEAWKLLEGKASGSFVEEMGRVARKYKGSIVLATQQLTDYFRESSPAAEKAFENASWKVVLKQNPEALAAMQHNPKLKEFVKDDRSLRLMQSLHVNPQAGFSEGALFGPGIFGVVFRLRLDPFSALLTSTNAADFSAINEKTAAGMSTADAIESVLQERGKC